MEKDGILTKHEIVRLDQLHRADMDLYNAACNIVPQWEAWKDKKVFLGLSCEAAQKKLVEAYWAGKRFHPEKGMWELLIQGRIEFKEQLN